VATCRHQVQDKKLIDSNSRWNSAIWLVPSWRTNSHFHWREFLIAQVRLGPAVGTRESYGGLAVSCPQPDGTWNDGPVLTSRTRCNCWSAMIGARSSGGIGDIVFAILQMRGLSGGPSILAGWNVKIPRASVIKGGQLSTEYQLRSQMDKVLVRAASRLFI